MEQHGKIERSEFSPSFSFYSSDNSTSMAAAKVVREEHAARFHDFEGVDEDDFQFSLELSDEEVSDIEVVFPVFKRNLLVEDDVHRVVNSKDDEIDASASITGTLKKMFINEREESTSCSSSEADELETLASGTYCVWTPKADGGSSSDLTKIKKSSSTGSGSKRWSIRYLLRRSNSEGKKPVVLLTPKKVDSQKQKRTSVGVFKVTGGLIKARTPVHEQFYEQFYVQRRAESEIGKRKSYLTYRQVGLFTNVNGMGKMLAF